MDVDDIEDLEIKVRLLSNWGHSNRIGLTEIQLYDTGGHRVDVDPANVTLHGAHGSSDVSCLFNGKCKVNIECPVLYHLRGTCWSMMTKIK